MLLLFQCATAVLYCNNSTFSITFSGGHDSATQLSKQVKKVNEKITKLVKQRNVLAEESLTFDDVKDPQSVIFHAMPVATKVPYHLHRKAIDNFCLLERSTEELAASQSDMKGLLSWHEKVISTLYKEIDNLTDTGHDEINCGSKAVLIHRAILHEKMYQQTVNTLKNIVGDIQEIEIRYVSLLVTHCKTGCSKHNMTRPDDRHNPANVCDTDVTGDVLPEDWINNLVAVGDNTDSDDDLPSDFEDDED